jgi:hypothetical protein
MNLKSKQRYCKKCNLPVGKGKSTCDQCKKEIKKKYNINRRVQNPKIKLITNNEVSILNQCIQNGINTPPQIKKHLQSLGISRSEGFIWKHLKRLGIYQYPNMDLIIYNRQNDKEAREKRIEIAESNGFTILSNDNRKTSKVKCNKCDSVISYTTMVSNGCYQCKLNQKTKTKFEKRDNKNSAKIIDYTNRVIRLKEFISSDRYKEYTNWKITPVIKEYLWYRSINNKEYKNKELDYSIDCINYYYYKSTNTPCPDKTTRGYKICNQCKEHKPKKEFNTNSKQSNGCKECAKEYRRIHYLPNEIKKTKERYKTDPVFKLDSICRAYLYGALKGKKKSKKTIDIIGVTPFELKQYIENRFESWMSWDNWGIGEGMWQVQHIIPRDFAINETEIYLINHYKNLIPMCATANGILKNRIVTEQLTEWHNTDKGIQKIIKRNKDSIITESELKKVLPIIVREIDTNRIKQSEQKLTKWFAY